MKQALIVAVTQPEHEMVLTAANWTLIAVDRRMPHRENGHQILFRFAH